MTSSGSLDEARDYVFPIRTGAQNYLSGTMGEIRSSHFHAGLDIKTQGVQGLEVFSSADGYISRIKVSTGGYGNALYVLHPNGTTTVYAHLQKYHTAVADYVRKAQYRNKTFEIELYPEKGQFPVKKGEVIGYSGNSGSSGGPHLHFEIRDNQQRPINPLKYRFTEIKDNIPPEVRKVALRTMDKQSRINDQYGRFEFSVIKRGSTYTLPVSISAYGNIGVEILAHDKLNGANNRNGVPCMELNFDQQQAFQQNLERFKFSETRSVLIHTDYQTAREKGQRFVKMYVDNGNQLPFYETNKSKGTINIIDDSTHNVQISLWDIYNNFSQVVFEIEGSSPSNKLSLTNYKNASKLDHKLIGNNLLIRAPTKGENLCAEIYSNRMRYQLDAVYQINQTNVFIWEMDRGLPDSLSYGNDRIDFNYKAIMPGGTPFNYYGEQIEIQISRTALFDTVFLTYDYVLDSASNREVFDICKDIYPIRKNINITLKPSLKYQDQGKTGVYVLDNRGNPSYVGGNWQGKKIKFKTRNWGRYTILADTVQPQVRALILNKDQLVFKIKDSLSGINKYELNINGTWVLMKYDYKKDLIRSEKLDTNIPYQGALELKVTDNAGNINTYSTRI